MNQNSQPDLTIQKTEEYLANFRHSLVQAGLSSEVAQQHTEKLSEIVALAVLNRIVDDHGPDVFATDVDEAERQRIISSLYTPEQLVELIRQEGTSQITLYFQALAPSLGPDMRSALAEQLGISV